MGEARAVCDLAGALIGQGKANEALDIAKRGHTLAHKHGGVTHDLTAWCAASLAKCYGAVGDTQSEITYLQEAISIFERLGDTEPQCDMWLRLGNVHRDMGELSNAKDAFTRGPAVFRRYRRNERADATSVCHGPI